MHGYLRRSGTRRAVQPTPQVRASFQVPCCNVRCPWRGAPPPPAHGSPVQSTRPRPLPAPSFRRRLRPWCTSPNRPGSPQRTTWGLGGAVPASHARPHSAWAGCPVLVHGTGPSSALPEVLNGPGAFGPLPPSHSAASQPARPPRVRVGARAAVPSSPFLPTSSRPCPPPLLRLLLLSIAIRHSSPPTLPLGPFLSFHVTLLLFQSHYGSRHSFRDLYIHSARPAASN